MTTTDAGKRNTHSFRAWDATWDDLTETGRDEGFSPATLLGDTADALAGYIRCPRCGGTEVPVQFGDLAGMSLREAVDEAERTVRFQKCNDHQRVLIEFTPGSGEVQDATTRRDGAENARLELYRVRERAVRAERKLEDAERNRVALQARLRAQVKAAEEAEERLAEVLKAKETPEQAGAEAWSRAEAEAIIAEARAAADEVIQETQRAAEALVRAAYTERDSLVQAARKERDDAVRTADKQVAQARKAARAEARDEFKTRTNIMELAAQGHTAVEIAKMTGVSRRMVSHYADGILQSVKSRPSTPVSPVVAEPAPAATVARLASQVEDIAPGTALFMEPGSEPTVTAPVPPPADHSRKRGRGAKCSHVVSAGTRCKICEPRP